MLALRGRRMGLVCPILCQIWVRFFGSYTLGLKPSSQRGLTHSRALPQRQAVSCHETATRSEPLEIGDNNGRGIEGELGRSPSDDDSRCAGKLHAPSCDIIPGAGRPSARSGLVVQSVVRL